MHVVGVGIPETGKDSPRTLPLRGVKSTDAVTQPAVLHAWEEVRGVSAHVVPDTPQLQQELWRWWMERCERRRNKAK